MRVKFGFPIFLVHEARHWDPKNYNRCFFSFNLKKKKKKKVIYAAEVRIFSTAKHMKMYITIILNTVK